MISIDDVLKRAIFVVGNVVAVLVVDFDSVKLILDVLLGLALERVEYGRPDEQIGERRDDEREGAHILFFHRRLRTELVLESSHWRLVIERSLLIASIHTANSLDRDWESLF